MNNELIATYLQKKRKAKGITQADLASEMGVTFQAVSRWENGDSIPDLDTLDHLATFYQVTVDDILQRDVTIELETEPDMTIPIFFFVIISYIVAIFILFFGKSSGLPSFVETLAYGFSFLCIIGSLFLQNMFYFVMSKKTSNSRFWYFITYIPFVITMIIFVLIDGGVID